MTPSDIWVIYGTSMFTKIFLAEHMRTQMCQLQPTSRGVNFTMSDRCPQDIDLRGLDLQSERLLLQPEKLYSLALMSRDATSLAHGETIFLNFCKYDRRVSPRAERR